MKKRFKAWILRWLGAVTVEDLEAYSREHLAGHSRVNIDNDRRFEAIRGATTKALDVLEERFKSLATEEQIIAHYTSHNTKLQKLSERVEAIAVASSDEVTKLERDLAAVISEVNDVRNKIPVHIVGADENKPRHIHHTFGTFRSAVAPRAGQPQIERKA